MKRKDAIKAAFRFWKNYCTNYSKGVACGMVILLLIYVSIALINPEFYKK